MTSQSQRARRHDPKADDPGSSKELAPWQGQQLQNKRTVAPQTSHPTQFVQFLVEVNKRGRHGFVCLFIEFPCRQAVTDLCAQCEMTSGHMLEKFSLRPCFRVDSQRVRRIVFKADLIFHRGASLSGGGLRSALNQPLGAGKGPTHLFLKRLSLKVSSRSISSSLSLMNT